VLYARYPGDLVKVFLNKGVLMGTKKTKKVKNRSKSLDKEKQRQKQKEDNILDKKLENTFPASDSTAEY
jgi:hypothetical protein